MRTINVNYDAVNTELRNLSRHISSNVTHHVQGEYRQMQFMLRETDGATNAELQDIMGANQEKTTVAASVLERLFSFMTNSSRQIQASENQLARAFQTTRR